MAGYDQAVYPLVMEHEAMVDHGSPVAPYRQIAAVLRGRIESGQYEPGQRLPSINDLMGEYGVAHLTANKALRLLVAEGVAELSPGMGFYVTERP
jgi:DNA-binding GntR family transcriptional regulator